MRRNNTHAGRGHAKRDFAVGLLLIVLMCLLKVGVEQTPAGHHLERAGYDWLQRRLSAGNVPVAVIDITDLRPAPFDLDGQRGVATPRQELLALLEAVVERRPSAVAVDIDFSQDLDGSYITPRDPAFFRSCLELSKRTGVPIFLGIKRSESNPPETWLGAEEYAGLAADVTVPKEEPVVNMPRWIRPAEDATAGRAMGAALASGYQLSQSRILDWLTSRGLVEQFQEKELGHGVGVGEFLVDYSPLESVAEARLRTYDPRVVRERGGMLTNKIVLIGDGTNCGKRDCFSAPAVSSAFPASTYTRAPLTPSPARRSTS